MTEEEARAWVVTRYPDAMATVDQLVGLVIRENGRQNLIAPSTIAAMWSRHITDSLQLVALADGANGRWIDIGTGGGFPGLAVAIVRREAMLLVEPRRRRADFLRTAATELGLDHVEVRAEKIERTSAKAGVISARAVASVEQLLTMASHLSEPETLWLLPRGAVTDDDIASLGRHKRMFHVEQSATAASNILVIRQGQQ